MHSYEKTLIEKATQLISEKPIKESGSVTWTSPSNIAIVKYWGKYTGQIPANPSMSLTLKEAHTKTKIAYTYHDNKRAPKINFKFHGELSDKFESRIVKYIDSLKVFMPWLSNTTFEIESENTFPHSSGIASSASAMSALALGLCEIENELYGKTDNDFFRKASFFARLGSGSASRSVFPNIAIWGITASCENSSDEYAIPAAELHPDFKNMQDSILIIESGKKKVSSSLGHDLMKTNPYAKLRFEAAEENMQSLCKIVRKGEMGDFMDIMENEALSIHAMMMTSRPGYMLMKPNTVQAIDLIRDFRNDTGNNVGFTLDAGANVHVVYPKKNVAAVRPFIDNELRPLCENELIIHDEMGNGPQKTDDESS